MSEEKNATTEAGRTQRVDATKDAKISITLPDSGRMYHYFFSETQKKIQIQNATYLCLIDGREFTEACITRDGHSKRFPDSVYLGKFNNSRASYARLRILNTTLLH